MRNDFFKCILLNGGSKNTAELEAETLPYTFNSNSYKLRNYRIYGNTVNGESVGDLVETGEHAEEYRVPVTVEGKNLFDISTVTAGAFINISTGVVTPSSTSNSNVSDFVPVLANENYIFSFDVELQAGYTFVIAYYDEDKTYLQLKSSYSSSANAYHYQLAFTPTNNGFIRLKYSSNSINMQVEKGSSSTPYEPYHATVTTNLYLPEQIKMVGDEAEYVDYKEQKQYFADGTSTAVTLPALPTLLGTNTLSVGTTVQPSKIYLQGKISKAEIVSAEPVQANVQSLQPFSLDFMPIDRSEIQTGYIFEKPVKNRDESEQEENIIETTRVDENAE